MVAVPTLALEKGWWRAGVRTVAGMDEVGRGSLAGPVAVGVAMLRPGCGPMPAGLRDSKLLTPRARTALVEPVQRWVSEYAVGYASPAEIDQIGIIAALRTAGMRALDQLTATPEVIILDGSHNWLTPPADLFTADDDAEPPLASRVVTIVKADRDCASVAAASVLAKCARDQIMVELDRDHPGYGWQANKGYASADHRQALLELGACAHHRRSWNLPTSMDIDGP